jgi:hypothetical protein
MIESKAYINEIENEQTIVMNPNILPNLKEWQLICTMVKQQLNLTDEEILQVGNEIEPLKGSTMEQAFIYFARAILRKAQQK